ncbi:acidic mammalian chitinase-like [Mercenaria mercenaria]|uniref:acidic mammalian chitinase-like n=1 Tax=Mercenaria mercenaria TaxID=6596 RepID=UPI00234EEA15|nr:acidic mammalian chitinase-like [Mercenaria mercenaria]
MKLFSRNVAIYLRDRDFDGIDVDWEWPNDIYRNKYSTLLKIMRDEFDKESVRTNKPRLLISIAVGVGEQIITDSYNISEISRYVDYIQIMAYDFYGPWSDITSFSSPLFSRASNPRFNQQRSQAWAVDRWISGGAPRNKLILGLTGTATTFTLANRTATGVGSPVLGPGRAGPYLVRRGHAPYYRVCEMISHGAKHHWDDEQKMAYAYMEDQWVGYGNQKSMKEKVRFAYNHVIAGVMFWSMDQDDFLGHYCNTGKFPLLTAIYNAIEELTPKDNHVVGDVSTSTMQYRPSKDVPYGIVIG